MIGKHMRAKRFAVLAMALTVASPASAFEDNDTMWEWMTTPFVLRAKFTHTLATRLIDTGAVKRRTAVQLTAYVLRCMNSAAGFDGDDKVQFVYPKSRPKFEGHEMPLMPTMQFCVTASESGKFDN
jgi:hypothetical protein